SSAFSLPPHSDAPIPIARIVDTDRYVGTNPSITMGQPIGLAEYANDNFFSKDTIFKTDAYPFPSWGSVNAGPMQIQNPRDSSGTVSRQYLTKVQDGDTGYRLCTAPVLYGLVPESAEYQAPILDENVYGDYAQRLIPRAVAYSAGLLKYFFRGAIEITVPEGGIYAFRDSISTKPREEGFSRITLRAKNVSEETEEMLGGTLELIIKYKLPEFDPLINHQAPYPAYPTEYQYIVAPLDSNSDHVIPRGNPIALEFTLPRDLPLWATDVSLSLVYKGKLGKNGGFVEEDAVGVGFKDISEPTPVDIMNSTDYLCMENSWYHVADPQILAQVQGVLGDQFPYDVSPRHIPVTYVRFSRADNPLNASSNEGEYTHAVHDLEDATYKRMFTLSDYTYHISMYNSGWTLVANERTGLKNQEDYTSEGAKARTIPSFRIYRGIPVWNEVVFMLRDICRGEDDKLSVCSSGCEDTAVPDGLELVP
ncbi:MAG: hypothetical protein LLG43_00345, partial [Deltaproteobacteria bacterium]|nr:hypothetical protein [Deltaproteobacteria bacterium]